MVSSRLLLLALLGIASQEASAQCTLCYLDETPTVTSDTCTQLATEADAFASATDPECVAIQVQGFMDCGCPPVPAEACSNVLCDSALPFPDRVIYRGEGIDPITCSELVTAAESDQAICDSLEDYRFYCGCGAPACTLCSSGGLSPYPDKVMKGFGPDFIPSESYTCSEAERQLSLVEEASCSSTLDGGDFGDIAALCGCNLPADETIVCDSLCFDEAGASIVGGQLVDPAFNDVVAVQDLPGFGTLTCSEAQLRLSEGITEGDSPVLDRRLCSSFSYVGVKNCGCAIDKPFCDLCEDGTPLSLDVLPTEVTFQTSCFSLAGAAFGADEASGFCSAARSTYGIYCGCDNPIASDGACRLCDEKGGEVVPDSNLTIPLQDFIADCGDIEFTGNDDTNVAGFTCDDTVFFGQQCCENAPSVAPSASPAPTDTFAPSSAPSGDATPKPTPDATPEPTPSTTDPGTPAPTPEPTPSSSVSVGYEGILLLVSTLAMVFAF